VLYDLREAIRSTEADIVCLQEVVGEHELHADRYPNWPDVPQYEYLADSIWEEYAYAKNSVYMHGHHGSAILSKFPIQEFHQFDLSAHHVEQRGALHCQIDLEGMAVHVFSVHLALLSSWRKRQFNALVRYVQESIEQTAPLIIAGDFNDWTKETDHKLAAPLGLEEVFLKLHGRLPKTYPARLPMLPYDRIYVRGFETTAATVISSKYWKRLSDHIPVMADLSLA